MIRPMSLLSFSSDPALARFSVSMQIAPPPPPASFIADARSMMSFGVSRLSAWATKRTATGNLPCRSS